MVWFQGQTLNHCATQLLIELLLKELPTFIFPLPQLFISLSTAICFPATYLKPLKKSLVYRTDKQQGTTV